jgi:small subunit ribosomal protein S21
MKPYIYINKKKFMLVVQVNNKNIERSLKELKSKVIKTRMMTELSSRKEFEKKSVKKRQERKKASYIQKVKTINSH